MAKKGSSKLGLAKKSKETEKKPTVKEETTIELATEPEVEDKIEKTKRMADSLLDGVNLKPNDDGILELDESKETITEVKNVQWFEEQLQKLTEDNQRLKAENEALNIDYGKIFEENQRIKSGGSVNTGVEGNVIELFNELQNNYMTMGFNQNGEPNFRILLPGFLNRLIKFFPFLAEHKRY